LHGNESEGIFVNTHQPDTSGLSRRKVVGAGLAGAAMSLGVARIAAAQPSDTTTPAAPTTEPPPEVESASTPPDAPTSGDVELLTFAVGAELAAADLYEDAVAAGAKSEGDINVFEIIGDNHAEYADVMAGELGVTAGQERNDALYDEWTPRFDTTDATELAAAAYELEAILLATHTELIGSIEGLRAAETIASILVPEARHCAILSDIAGTSDDLDITLDKPAEPLSPDSAAEASP
jgi:hypothetical protein